MKLGVGHLADLELCRPDPDRVHSAWLAGTYHTYMYMYFLTNAVSSKAKKVVDGTSTLPKKVSEVEIVCRVSQPSIVPGLFYAT